MNKMIRLYFDKNTDFYNAYDEDAYVLGYIFNFKIFWHKSYKKEAIGFPKKSIITVISKLKELKINYQIIIEKELFENGDENYNNVIKKLIEKRNNTTHSHNSKSDAICVGDTVYLLNLTNNQTEIYTIVPVFLEYKPVGISKDRYSFGEIIYKEVFISESNPELGKISELSDVAKELLNKSLNDIVSLYDENLNKCNYKIIRIEKCNVEFS